MKKKILWFILHLEEIISVIGLTGMLLFTIFNVVMRYAFDSPKGWATEFAVIFLVWATFPGAAACHKRNLHYGMDFLVNRLSPSIQYRLRQILMGVCVILFSLLAYVAVVFTIRTTKTTSFFMISYRFINSSAIVGFTSMTLYSLYFFIKSIKDPDYFKQYYANAYQETDDMKVEIQGRPSMNLIPVLILAICFMLGFPCAFSLILSVIPYFILDPYISINVVIQRLVSSSESISLMAVPFFITAGTIMNYSGISAKLMALADALVGHLTGGLGHVNVPALHPYGRHLWQRCCRCGNGMQASRSRDGETRI